MAVEDRLAIIHREMEALYQEHRQIRLLYPFVMVMVLNKRQRLSSGIIAPDKQNKVMHEGIVMATWNEKFVERGTVERDGSRVTRCEILHSELTPGDHVLFHHYSGQPIHGYDDQRFRVLRETGDDIIGKIHYADRNTRAVTALVSMMSEWRDNIEPLTRSLLIQKIDDQFVVLDRDSDSLTLSGA